MDRQITENAEILITAAAANHFGFSFEITGDRAIFTGSFLDVQWENHTLYFNPRASILHSCMHELGHILTSTPEELRATNYGGRERSSKLKEMGACYFQSYVLWRFAKEGSRTFTRFRDVVKDDYNLDPVEGDTYVLDEYPQSGWTKEVLNAVEEFFDTPVVQEIIRVSKTVP